MLALVIPGPNFSTAKTIVERQGNLCDLFEIRCDLFEDFSLTALQEFCASLSKPYILTLRTINSGGGFQGTEVEREKLLLQLASLHPPYIDLENDLSKTFLNIIRKKTLTSKIILSYHAFHVFPEDLAKLYEELKTKEADLYKIAVIVKNAWEAFQLLLFAKRCSKKPIVIGMGEDGIFTRILPPILGLPLTYAAPSLKTSVAPGQLPIDILVHRYRYPKLSPKSKIFGLIGDPVQKSIGDITHNAIFGRHEVDGVYLKIRVEERYLSSFLQAAKEVGFTGLSVTMPLKETILHHVDRIDRNAREAGAANTLVWKNGWLHASNTDGAGAMAVIANHRLTLKGLSILLLGAGGAARAIAVTALTKGASVSVFNRSAKRLFSLVAALDGRVQPLLELSQDILHHFDIMINCTPSEHPINPELIPHKKFLMDIQTRPKITSFLAAGRERGCEIISGYEMFIEQALGQYRLWFKDSLEMEELRLSLLSICQDAE